MDDGKIDFSLGSNKHNKKAASAREAKGLKPFELQGERNFILD